MAKDRPSSVDPTSSKADRKAARKAEKKAAKAARAEGSSGVTKTKSDKKEKRSAQKALAEKALNELDVPKTKSDNGTDDEVEDDGEEEVAEPIANGASHGKKSDSALAARPLGALVPFANPLADDKTARKVFKCVKKAAAQRTLKRGVKEVVKVLRKTPIVTSSDANALPSGIVVLAADISPMDVISHIPVLAEDHSIPYVYVTSRAELGAAGMTKRPTSVVLISREAGKKPKDAKEKSDADGEEPWDETYKSLFKIVLKEGRHVKV